MRNIIGDLCHDQLVANGKQEFGFEENCNYREWKKKIKDKFYELLGFARIEKNACPLNIESEKEVQKDGYKQIRFTFESEKGAFVPCYLCIPDTGKEKYPVAICLQGHSSGFHNSIAEPKDDSEIEYATGRGAFAVQAVKNGYASLAIEQRAMGERITSRHPFDVRMCTFALLSAIELGRTLVGERAWDVHKAIDALEELNYANLDLSKILVVGNSGGGTASFYSACFDERIKLAVPSCSFCSYKESILDMYHCACNYIPGAYNYFEMGDLTCLIAPRNFMPVTGAIDTAFPLHGVQTEFEKAEKIYEIEGAEDKCRLIVTPKGHYFCEDIVWGEINEETKKMGW